MESKESMVLIESMESMEFMEFIESMMPTDSMISTESNGVHGVHGVHGSLWSPCSPRTTKECIGVQGVHDVHGVHGSHGVHGHVLWYMMWPPNCGVGTCSLATDHVRWQQYMLGGHGTKPVHPNAVSKALPGPDQPGVQTRTDPDFLLLPSPA